MKIKKLLKLITNNNLFHLNLEYLILNFNLGKESKIIIVHGKILILKCISKKKNQQKISIILN